MLFVALAARDCAGYFCNNMSVGDHSGFHAKLGSAGGVLTSPQHCEALHHVAQTCTVEHGDLEDGTLGTNTKPVDLAVDLEMFD